MGEKIREEGREREKEEGEKTRDNTKKGFTNQNRKMGKGER